MSSFDDPMADIQRDLFGEVTPAQQAKACLTNAVPLAAAQIVDLALNSSQDRIRLQASQVILDRVLGPVGKDDANDTLNEFLEGIAKLAGSQ